MHVFEAPTNVCKPTKLARIKWSQKKIPNNVILPMMCEVPAVMDLWDSYGWVCKIDMWFPHERFIRAYEWGMLKEKLAHKGELLGLVCLKIKKEIFEPTKR